MKKIKDAWITKRKREITLEFLEEDGNTQHLLELDQAEKLMFQLEEVIRKIRKQDAVERKDGAK